MLQSTFKEESKSSYKNIFPCLMKWDKVSNMDSEDIIVLFTSYKEGIVLVSSEGYYKIGHKSEDWNIDSFLPYEGTVTISSLLDIILQ